MSDEVKERTSPLELVVGQLIVITERPVLQQFLLLTTLITGGRSGAMNAVREKLKLHAEPEMNHIKTITLPSEENIPAPVWRVTQKNSEKITKRIIQYLGPYFY